MSKTKKTGAEHYEMLYIVPNKFTEDESKKIVEKVRKVITENGGTITYEENWGKKKLSYTINHNNHGYYNLFEFDCEREKLARIERLIKMDQDILRHMIIKKKVETEEEKESQKKIAEKIAIKNINKKAEEEKKEEKAEQKQKETKKKVDLDELDDKLDKILDTNDLL